MRIRNSGKGGVKKLLRLFVGVLVGFGLGYPHEGAGAAADLSVAVVMGPNAPELDKFAARELCGYLRRLFGIQTVPTTNLPPSSRALFLIGNPSTNPLNEDRAFQRGSGQ